MLRELDALVDQLNLIRRELSETLQRLNPEQLQEPFPGQSWSIRDALAHLAANESLMTDVLNSIATGAPSPLPPDFDNDRFNAETVASARAESVAQVREGLNASRSKLLAALDSLTPEQLQRHGEHPLEGMLTVKEFLAVMYAHEASHVREIVAQARRLRRGNEAR